MISYFDVVIVHLDDTEERVQLVSRQVVDSGVLHLFQRDSSYGPNETHLGSWPLAAIKKWTRYPR